jgi:hypothetical protein
MARKSAEQRYQERLKQLADVSGGYVLVDGRRKVQVVKLAGPCALHPPYEDPDPSVFHFAGQVVFTGTLEDCRRWLWEHLPHHPFPVP